MAKKKAAKPLPRQKALPGMADRKIAVLEKAALDYADIRDQRMVLTKEEVSAKQRVKQLMHAQKIDHYIRANIEISLEPEDEKVIVRVRDRKPAVDEPVDQPPAPVEEPEEAEQPEEEDPDEYDSKEEENPF